MVATRPYFIFGCQRSGTTITVDVFGKSDLIQIFPETDPRANQLPLQDWFAEDVRLRSTEEIARLVDDCKRPAVVFKPLMDCQYADKILERHAGRGFWMYRHYTDVANSAVTKWGPHQKHIIDAIHNDNWSQLGWRTERLSAERIRQIKALWRDDLSEHEGAAIFWLMRNCAFFDHKFVERDDIRLVRYEELVRDPKTGFQMMLDFMDLDFDPSIVSEVHARSVKKAEAPRISDEIRGLCDGLLADLEQARSRQEA